MATKELVLGDTAQHRMYEFSMVAFRDIDNQTENEQDNKNWT
jgi:hypothetical protein